MPTILLIDDDPLFLSTLTEALNLGYRDITINTATTAERGLRLLAQYHFDAIVSDFRMSGLNGIDLLKECKSVCPNTPVVLITGYGSRALEQDALDHGAYAVLQKPLDSAVIYSVVTRAILRCQLLQRSLPSDLTPLDIQATELATQQEQLSTRIRQVTERLQEALDKGRSSS
jgi:DNA-binding NtrC family response regulator